MDVVAHARAVACRIVGAEYVEAGQASEGCLRRPFDEMRCPARRLPRAPHRVGASDIEVAQRDKTEIVCARDVLQHPLGHQL